MRDLVHPDRDMITLAGVLHALSDSTRLAVVRQIDAAGEQLCGCLSVDVAKSTLSQHLKVLRQNGVIATRCAGTQRWLTLRRDDLDALFPGLLDVVLSAPDRAPGTEDRAPGAAGRVSAVSLPGPDAASADLECSPAKV